MKKWIALMLVLVLSVGLVACGGDDTAEEETPVVEDEVITEEEPIVDEEVIVDDEPAVLPEEEAEDSNRLPEIEMTDDTIEEILATEYMPEEKLAELTALVEQLVAGINDELLVGTVEITPDMYEYYGIPATEGAYAVVSMPMIGSIAHEVVLVEVPEGTDAEAFATEMELNLDPMKWVCVQPENTWVKAYGNYVVSVMSSADMANGVLENCNTVFGA